MIIGIPRETRVAESRVALIPQHVALLVQAGHRVRLERDAGKGSRFSNKEYQSAGARLVSNVYDSEMIVRVKEPPKNSIKRGQIIMGYLHVQKGQDTWLLETLLDRHVTSYAYEEIRDAQGERLVNLGVEAGIVGMYEGLRLYGKILAGYGIQSTCKSLTPARKCFSAQSMFRTLQQADVSNEVSVYIMGKGKVSQGAQQVLKHSPIEPGILQRRETAGIARYLPRTDIILNAVDWYPHEPRVIKKEMLRLMKKTALIVDISCDVNGAVETCIPTSWQHPTYSFNDITHFCVDNLPAGVEVVGQSLVGFG